MSTAGQGRGKSWECAAGSHGSCGVPGCVCACHYTVPERIGDKDTAVRDIVSTPVDRVPTPPHDPTPGLRCPKCNSPAGAGDRFCRKDGTALRPATVHCAQCGIEAPAQDLYCAACGRPLSDEVTVR